MLGLHEIGALIAVVEQHIGDKQALAQHQEYNNFNKEKIYGFIRHSLLEIDKLENVANSQNERIIIDKDEAINIIALWDFSGPGIYYGKEKEDDKRVFDGGNINSDKLAKCPRCGQTQQGLRRY